MKKNKLGGGDTPPAPLVKLLLTSEASSLKLALIAGKKGLSRRIETSNIGRPWRIVTGSSESASAGSIQLIGAKELDLLAALSREKKRRALERLNDGDVAALVLVDKSECPTYLRDFSRRRRIPLFSTPLGISIATRRIRRFVEGILAKRKIVHGVLMDIYGLGTLIVGESGIGKSESALELIERGHRLVSDDIIEIYREPDSRAMGGGPFMGRSPALTRYFMELRGLGIINVKDLFGPNSIRLSRSVDLVIQLERWEKATEIERLGLEEESYSLLDGKLPLVRMPVGPGRNLAMLIEVAARNHLLKESGRHPARRLMRKVRTMADRDRRK